MRIQLWSYNYAPEPTGIGPVSATWARGLRERGHDIDVVAAHPHYPDRRWGIRRRPYREVRDGVPVLRLPLWVGRDTARQRYRQELSYAAAHTAALPFLGRPDVIVATSPSFPALLTAILHGRVRETPWVLWLHDILPDGATASGLIDERSPVIRVSRMLEAAAYRSAERIVVLSRAFTDNLTAKGVPEAKIELIYDPATRVPSATRSLAGPEAPTVRLLSMGNIGFSQGLADLVDGFERRTDLNPDVRIVITGEGMAAAAARAAIRTDRVRMVGLLDDADLERELQSATVALVTQRHTGGEFNIPSKLMNFMAYGLPVLAAVNPTGEVARIIRESGAGWVVDSSDPAEFPKVIHMIQGNPEDVVARGRVAKAFADEHFSVPKFAEHFDSCLRAVAGG